MTFRLSRKKEPDFGGGERRREKKRVGFPRAGKGGGETHKEMVFDSFSSLGGEKRGDIGLREKRR